MIDSTRDNTQPGQPIITSWPLQIDIIRIIQSRTTRPTRPTKAIAQPQRPLRPSVTLRTNWQLASTTGAIFTRKLREKIRWRVYKRGGSPKQLGQLTTKSRIWRLLVNKNPTELVHSCVSTLYQRRLGSATRNAAVLVWNCNTMLVLKLTLAVYFQSLRRPRCNKPTPTTTNSISNNK